MSFFKKLIQRQSGNSWPHDETGDVFRRLAEHGLDFSREYTVDYVVDFATWPPAPDAVTWLEAQFGSLTVFEPEGEHAGSIQFQVRGLVVYEEVKRILREVSAAMHPYGGYCDSWGVLVDN